MSSPWSKSCRAWFGKELRCEIRSKHGLYSSALFGFMAVVTAVFATAKQTFPPTLAAGFLVVVLVFSAVVTVPRIFLVEEDQRTIDLARLLAPPSAIFIGKATFGTLLNAAAGFLFSLIFVTMARAEVIHWPELLLGSMFFAMGLAQCLAVCSALVIGADNRWILAGVVALPLVLPIVFCGVGVTRYAFGDGSWNSAAQNFLILIGYTVGLGGLGPVLIDAVWGTPQKPNNLSAQDPNPSPNLTQNKEAE